MIAKIILHNYQSHVYTEIDFSTGINSIVGESNMGKTAIMRAFEGVRENKNFGLENASHWITHLDKNDKPILDGVMESTVVFTEGKYVTRRRDETGFNGYITGTWEDDKFTETERFNKIGVKVPFVIRQIFNMDDVNIQKQHDSMFLLSDSGQDVARYFNRLIKLDIADTALTLAKSKKLTTNRERKAVQEELEELEEALGKLSWVDDAAALLDKIELTQSKMDKAYDKAFDIGILIDNITATEKMCVLPEYHEKAEMVIARIDMASEKIETMDNKIYAMAVLENDIREINQSIKKGVWVEEAKEVSKRIDSIDSSMKESRIKIQDIGNTIEAIETCENFVSSTYTKEAVPIVTNIDELNKNMVSTMDKIDSLEMLIDKMKSCKNKIAKSTSSIFEMKKRLPETCPTCGQKLEVV